MRVLVTGGVRSGESPHAESLPAGPVRCPATAVLDERGLWGAPADEITGVAGSPAHEAADVLGDAVHPVIAGRVVRR
jgi:hypothetical protein